MKYDWTKISNEGTFSDLINYLLREKIGWAEISVSKGKDKGIDARYIGKFRGKKGDWIFQYKWYNPETGKRANLSNLKSKILTGGRAEAKYIKKVYDPENYIVITNLRLTGPNKREFKTLAKGIGIKFFEVWDIAELEILINQFPSAQRKFFENKGPIIENYRERFKEELEDQSSIFYCGENSPFLSRDEDLNRVINYLESSAQTLILTGRGGVGKSRLIIELAKKTALELKDSFVLYFVSNSSDITIGNILSVLPRKDVIKKKIILILDDAHNYSNNLLSNIDYLVKDENYEIKLILLTRPELFETVKVALPFSPKISNYEHLELTNIDIKSISEIIRDKIKDRELAKDIVRWARKGRWTPLETNLVISESEKSNLSFKETISESLLIDQIFKKYFDAHDEDSKSLLKLISFIQPFNYQDSNLKEAIKKFLSWSDTKYIETVDTLINSRDFPIVELSEGYPIIRIRPDILSDWLRDRASYKGESVSEYVKKVLNSFISITSESVIEGIVQTEYGKKNKILDEIIEDIHQDLLKSDNSLRINILKIVNKLAWYRPEDAIRAVRVILDNPQEEYTLEKFDAFKITHEHVLREIPELLEKVGVRIEYFNEVIEILLEISTKGSRYAVEKAEESLLSLSKIIYRRSLEYNENLINLLKNEVSSDNSDRKKLLVKVLKEQFKLSIHYSYLDPEDPKKFIFTEYPVKAVYRDIKPLIQLRSASLELLFKIIENSDSNVKLDALGLLSSIIYGLNKQYSAFGRTKLEGKNKYSSIVEYEKIYQFCNKLVNLELRKNAPDLSVLNELVANSLKELKSGYVKKTGSIQKIQDTVKKSDKYKWYELLLAEHKDWDQQRKDLTNILKHDYIKRVIDSYRKSPSDFLTFIESMLELRKGWVFGTIKSLFVKLGENELLFSEKIFKSAFDNENNHFIYTYLGYLLIGIRRNNIDKANELIETALSKKTHYASQVIADSFDHYWVVTKNQIDREIKSEDLSSLIAALKFAEGTSLVSLANASNTFLRISKDKALDFLVNLSQKVDKDSIGLVSEIVSALDPREISYDNTDIPKIENILNSFVNLYDLDKDQMTKWYLEQIFPVILNYDAPYIVKFFKNRLEKKIQLNTDSEYDAIPYGFKLPTLDDPAKELLIFNELREWVLRKDWFAVETPHFVSKLGFSAETIQKGLSEWIDGSYENKDEKYKYLIASAYMLRNFEDSPWVYDLVAKILIQASEFESDPETFRNIMSEVWAFIHTGGGWGDTKHRQVITEINRILQENSKKFSPLVKKRLLEEIAYQEKEITRLNELMNGDWD